MNMISRVLGFIVGLSCAVTSAYIYEIKVLRRWNSNNNNYQYVIGLSDFHDKTHEANLQQRAYLTNLFKRCCEHKVKVLVEDISSHGAQGRMHCGPYFVDSQGGVLGGITKVCKECGISDSNNVEYRYCRVTSLGPVVNNINKDIRQIASSSTITVGALLQEVDAMMNEVKQYDDGKEFNTYYADTLRATHQEIKKLKLQKYKKRTVADYVLDNEHKMGRFELVKDMLTFDSVLVDAKMLHEIYDAGEKATVMAIAGGAHIARVCEELQKAGYESVHSSKITMMRETDLRKCVGCTIVDGTSCLKPMPISISILDEFL